MREQEMQSVRDCVDSPERVVEREVVCGLCKEIVVPENMEYKTLPLVSDVFDPMGVHTVVCVQCFVKYV